MYKMMNKKYYYLFLLLAYIYILKYSVFEKKETIKRIWMNKIYMWGISNSS